MRIYSVMASLRASRDYTPWIMVPIIAALYAAFLTRTYYWDGVLFSLYIEAVHRGAMPLSVLFHPNHLVYTGFGYAVYEAALALGNHARAITVLQVVNVVLSVMAGFVLYMIARRAVASRALALFCWLLFAFGATWWKFSTDADAYIVSVLLLLFAVLFAVRNPPLLFAAGACHVLAMLFHELAVFAYFPVITAILLRSKWPRHRRVAISCEYIAGTASCVAACYFGAYASTDRGAYPSLWRWVTSYASNSGFTRTIGQITSGYLGSYGKLFLGGKLVFLRQYWSPAIGAALAVCIVALIRAAYLLRSETAAETRLAAEPAVLWAWFAPCAIFLACWDPASAFHKLFLWPPLVLLIAVYIARSRTLNRKTGVFIMLAIAIASWNFADFIYPHSHVSADPVLALAEKVNRELPRNATVCYRALSPDDWYLEYFAPGRRWLQISNAADLKQITAAAIGPVCLDTTALEQQHVATDSSLSWNLTTGGHYIRLECLNRMR